jgi:hypothetical protein
MRNSLKESGHLIRFVLVVVAGFVIFMGIRAMIVPKSFGQYGHYRGAVLEEIRSRPISFAGRATCEACHDEVAKVKSAGKHAGLGCEACHGPSAAHTEDPMTNHAVKPNPATLCVRCHEADPARPRTFPQVSSQEHANGMSCGDCHKPHTPQI